MYKIKLVFVSALLIIAFHSCSKKYYPNPSVAHTDIKNDTSLVVNKNDSAVITKKDSLLAIKPVIKRKPKETIPKVIVVNDKYANKSVDGRYYYDVEGHRYWRNNNDGKYYLFNKSMLTDDAFKKPN